MPTINNWSLVSKPLHAYQAPEQSLRLRGEVTGHPDFEDGSDITTSRIKEIKGGKVYTSSGSEYTLGTVDPVYEALYPNALQRLLSKESQNEEQRSNSIQQPAVEAAGLADGGNLAAT